MATLDAHPSDHTSVEHPAALARWASRRQLHVDNLKVILIAAIIAGHAVGSYTSIELWTYADVREVTLSPVTEAVLLAVVMPFALFIIPLLFLIAGLLTPPSLERQGAGVYVRDRLVRLGVPFAVFGLLVWPAILYALYRPLGNAPGSYLAELVGTSEEALDTGYLWFVGDLLLFSLAYAAWVRLRHGHPGTRWAGRHRRTPPRGARRGRGRRDLPGPAAVPVRQRALRRPQRVPVARMRGAVRPRHHGGAQRLADRGPRTAAQTQSHRDAGRRRGFAAFVAWGAVSGGLAGDTWRGG